MSVRGNTSRVLATPIKASLPVLVVVLVLVGLFAAGHTGADADDLEMTGTLSQQVDGTVGVDDGSTTYAAVGSMDFTPFLGQTVDVVGTVSEETLFVRHLTLGTIDVDDQSGTVDITTTGTVEQTADGFQTTVGGIAFTLYGSDELAQVVGQTVQIQGELTGSWISVTSLSI